MQTFNGIFDLAFPSPTMVSIYDIARSLAYTCRFGGHLRQPYSVAQHSCLVSDICEDAPLEGLLHDAGEAYYGDWSSPLKAAMAPNESWRQIQERIDAAIVAHFGLSTDHAEAVGKSVRDLV